jgi:MSHA biogenesis protein MshI
VEIRPGGIAVAHVTPRGSGPPVLGACVYQGVEGEGETLRHLTEVVKAQGLTGSRCVNVLEPRAYTLLLVEAPEVEPAELKSALRWRVKDLLDFHVDDAVLDAFAIPGHALRGRPRMLYVAAARASLIGRRAELLRSAGLEVTAMDIPELALRNIAALLPEDINGLALLLIRDQASIITLTRQATLYLTRGIEVGSEQLLRAATPPGTAPEAIMDEGQRVIDALVLEVQRSLDYYESHSGQPPVTGLLLAPLETPIPGLADYLSERLALPVDRLELGHVLEGAQALDPATAHQCLAAMGGALRAADAG